MNREELMSRIPGRADDANKGTYGKLLLVAGSRTMCGAAMLAGLAAYRSGTGLVRILTHEENRSILLTALPEAIIDTYDDTYRDSEGNVHVEIYTDDDNMKDLMRSELNWADTVVAGPGMGQSEIADHIIGGMLSVLAEENFADGGRQHPHIKALVLDADALNIIASNEKIEADFDRAALTTPIVVTPHPMEMSRLTGLDIQKILAEPVKVATEFSKKHHVVTLLKGSHTVVVDNDALYVNDTPSPALAKAGSGDVLSGLIGGVFEILKAGEHGAETLNKAKSDGSRLFTAAAIATIVHCEAGRQAAQIYGVHGVLARDTANQIGKVLDEYI